MVAVAAISADPGDGLAIGVLRDLCERGRHWRNVDEAVIEAERTRAVTEDRAAHPRTRGGHLRPVV